MSYGMKAAIAFFYFFGSILLVFALLWLGFFLAPPEFTLDRTILPTKGDLLTRSQHIFPTLGSREPYTYPGSRGGLKASDGKLTAWLLVFGDSKEAESAFKEYARRTTAGVGRHQSSGRDFHAYRRDAGEVRGRIQRIGEIVVRVEAETEQQIEETFGTAGLFVPNEGANLLTDMFRKGKHLPYLLIGILIYAALQLPIWNRVGSWASAIAAKEGTPTASEEELRSRLLAINGMDVPFLVEERKNGMIDVTWRLADAKWAGLVTLNKVTIIHMIRLRLSDKEKTCRALDIARTIRATADGLKMRFAVDLSFFRGIVLGKQEYEKQYGLIYRDGRLTIGTAYKYTFGIEELRNPIVNIVTQSGWHYKPVMFISKILGG